MCVCVYVVDGGDSKENSNDAYVTARWVADDLKPELCWPLHKGVGAKARETDFPDETADH